MNQNTKNILQSKTFWANLIIAGVYPFIPKEFQNELYLGYFLGAVNIGLRLISKDKVVLK